MGVQQRDELHQDSIGYLDDQSADAPLSDAEWK